MYFSPQSLCRSRRLDKHQLLVATLAALTVLTCIPADAFAACRIREHAVKTSANGTLSLGPARLDELTVIPGKPAVVPGLLANRYNKPITVALRTTDLQASPNPSDFVRSVEHAEFGAGSWIQTDVTDITLLPGQVCEFGINVTAPMDAPVGSSYAALLAKAINDTPEGDAEIGTTGQALSELFFRVDGPIVRKGKVVDAEISRQFFFNGSGYVSYGFEYANLGTVSDTLRGKIVIKSLFGNVITELPFKDFASLRGSHRKIEELWTNPPRFGRFTATLVLKTDSGTYKEEFPAVVVLPPKWVVAASVLALLLPFAFSIYRRRTAWKRFIDDDEHSDWDAEARE